MKRRKLKWKNILLLVVLIACISLIIHDIYMNTIYTFISGRIVGWTWFGFLTYIMAFVVSDEIIKYLSK